MIIMPISLPCRFHRKAIGSSRVRVKVRIQVRVSFLLIEYLLISVPLMARITLRHGQGLGLVRERSQLPDLPSGTLSLKISVLPLTSTVSNVVLKTYYFNIHFNTPWGFLLTL